MTPILPFRRAHTRLAAALVGVFLVNLLAGCAPAAPASQPEPTLAMTATSAPAPQQPTLTALPSTATSQPTLEPTTAPTPEPAFTATPAVTQVSGDVSAWCVLDGDVTLTQAGRDPAQISDSAKVGTLENGAYGLVTPSKVCNLAFTLNTPVAEGIILEILDAYENVWLDVPLTVSTSNPNVGVAVMTHSYIVEPPFWEIIYPVRLLAPDGSVIWEGKINAHRGWRPAPCWDGTLPNISTLYCPKQQDLHPWDPAYTPVPGGNP